MERSFAKEVASLRLGDGDTFHGEGILAVTKALLQSGVSYVGGYQGAPVSHLMDVLSDAKDVMDELGVHFEACPNEAAAAAMLGASINYPLRGAVTWKSTVGTNVASDALSNLASAGVKGGVLILVGEDYGEGASIIQERSHAFAMKSSIWLLDPRPHHPRFVELIEQAFDLSEVSNTPVMMEFRIRACHAHGSFATKTNRKPLFSRNHLLAEPEFDYARICLPPSTYVQEKEKFEHRFPAAMEFVRAHGMNERFEGDLKDVGIVLQGGMYNSVMRALGQVGLADAFGHSRVPLFVLNVTYPLIPGELEDFCRAKRAVLMVEEGHPDYLEQALHAILRKSGIGTALHGKDVLPMAGEYTAEVLLQGLSSFLAETRPAGLDVERVKEQPRRVAEVKQRASQILGKPMPKRPPGFCTGCPERPIFSALKIAQEELGKVHISADIGCHTFATLPPFNMGNTVLGYGLGLASAAGVTPHFAQRVVTVMGDGGFWHNGLSSGVTGAQFNRKDEVLLIVNNGYSSATGQQLLPSSPVRDSNSHPHMSIESALRGLGVTWLRKVNTYRIRDMVNVLREALTTKEGGLKVIEAEGECMLAQQRRFKPWFAHKLKTGQRVIKERFGVDEDVCTGDHSCIRLSGCPSLTIKPNPDPLRPDPVATVDHGCVACGVCGEVAQAAALCPSFYRADRIHNPNLWDRTVDGFRRGAISLLQRIAGERPGHSPDTALQEAA